MFCLSWYLDSVSPNWEAIIWGDYKSAFPLTIIHKAGIPQIIQPIFTRELNILGNEISIEELLQLLKSNYKNIDFRMGKYYNEFPSSTRTHQILNLKKGFEKNFSNNAKRLIKKADRLFSYKIISDLSDFLKLIEKTLAPKINELNSDNLVKLKNVMINAQANKKALCIAILNDTDEFIGAGFFFKHHNTITYLKGTATNIAKKNGAMFGLINFSMNLFVKNFTTFDFGGSDIKNVASFYRKFGATDRIYYHYKLNNLPFWYKWTKKLMKNR